MHSTRGEHDCDGCPDGDTLGSLATGEEVARDALLAHLERCADCSDRLCELGTTQVDGRPLCVGRYRVMRWIGESASAVVFAAWDASARRMVALKVVVPDQTGGRGVAQMLERARRLIGLRDPHVAQVYDAGVDRGQFFIAVEIVRGSTLERWQRQRRRPWTEVVSMYRRAARGLATAHEHGVTHGDFRPGNVLVGHDGRLRVTDFAVSAGPTSSPAQDRRDFCQALRHALFDHHGGALPAGRTSLPPRIAHATLRGATGAAVGAAVGDGSMRSLAAALDRPRRSRSLLLAPAVVVGLLIGLGSIWADRSARAGETECNGPTATATVTATPAPLPAAAAALPEPTACPAGDEPDTP